MPRAALKDLANRRGLERVATDAKAAELADGHKPDASYDEAGGVELWADWPFSCVRLRGDPATVRRAVRWRWGASVSRRAAPRPVVRCSVCRVALCEV